MNHEQDIIAYNEVGRVYAEALAELAEEQGQLEEIADEIEQLASLLVGNAGLRTLLETPALNVDSRAGLLQRLFEGKLSGTLYKLLQVMNLKGRANELPALIAAFRMILNEKRGIVPVQAYVASPMDADTLGRVKAQIGSALGGKTVELTEHVDDSLIGGLKVRIDDKLIDATVATQLRTMRRQLIEAGRAKAAATPVN